MRLKNYVFFRETETGVWFDAGRRSFALNGKGIYPLVERLLNALEQSDRSPDDLAAQVPEKLRPFAERLFGELARHDMLQRGILPKADAKSHEHSAYTEFLKYLEDNIDDDSLEEKLSRWREATIAIVGDGYAAKAAAGVLADSGCGRVIVRCISTDEVGPEEFEQSLRDRGDSSIEVAAGAFDPSGIEATADGLIIAGGEAFPVEQAIEYAAHGRNAGMTVCASLPVNGNLAVLAMDALDAPGMADLADWLLPPLEIVTPSSENLAIAGSIAAQEMIARFFGIDNPDDATARIVSPYSEVSLCPIPPSPRRHGQDVVIRSPDFKGRIELPEGRDLSKYELLRIALKPWTDPALAVLGLDLPEALPQLPVYHEAFAVRRPGMGRDMARIAVGWGLSAEDAGIRASMSAIAMLAEEEFGGDQVLAAGMGEEAWQSAALAGAFIRRDRFAREAVWGRFAADDLDYPGTRVVLDILRFQIPSQISFRVGFVPGVPAIVAACDAGGECLASVCSPVLSDAIREAIGLAASKIQLRSVERLARPDDIVLPAGSESVTLAGLDAITKALDVAQEDLQARFVRSRRLGLPDIVSCGYAVLEERS